jgi:hypothetical protein
MIAQTSAPDADSLRAAALKTLKLGKKRRPTYSPLQPVPLARPLAQDILHLDYGQDDNSTEVYPVSAEASPSTSNVHAASSGPTMPEPDVDMREEGEISDEEPPPAAVNPLKPTLDQPDSAPKYAQADRPPVTSMSSLSGSPVPSLLNRISSPPSRSPTSPAHIVEGLYPPLGIGQEPTTGTPPTYFLSVSPQESVSHEDHYFSFEELDHRDIHPGLHSKLFILPPGAA